MKRHDNHIHVIFDLPIEDGIRNITDKLDRLNVASASFLSVPCSSHAPEGKIEVTENVKCLAYKHCVRGENYAYAGCISHSDNPSDYVAYAEEAKAMGFDGFKVLEGIPRYRRDVLKRPLCNPAIDALYGFAEKNNMPMVFHIGNPIEFWDISKATPSQIALGRVYDGSFPTLESLYTEALTIAANHPALKIVFAHFFFMSDNYDRICEIMEKYPNIYLDLTPGGEMYVNFGKDIEKWQRFFRQYSHRIIAGTDTYNDTAAPQRNLLVEHFLESAEPFTSYLGTTKPLCIEQSHIENIWYNNAVSLVGKPKPIDMERLSRVAAKLKSAPVLPKTAQHNLDYIRSLV